MTMTPYLTRIRESILDQIRDLEGAGLLVRHLADEPLEYLERLDNNGEIVIECRRVQGGEQATGGFRQKLTVQVTVMLRLRNLRDGEASADMVIWTLQMMMHGFQPRGASGVMAFQRATRTDRDETWWVYELIWEVPAVLVRESAVVGDRLKYVAFTGHANQGQRKEFAGFDPVSGIEFRPHLTPLSLANTALITLDGRSLYRLSGFGIADRPISGLSLHRRLLTIGGAAIVDRMPFKEGV